MLADELDYVIGVDPHRDTHAFAVVDVRSGGVVFEATAVADGEGYAERAASCRRSTRPAGAPSRSRALARSAPVSLDSSSSHERAGARGRPAATGAALGGKTDALDAIRAARSVLGQNAASAGRAPAASERRYGR